MPLTAAFFDVGCTLLREEPSRQAIYAAVAHAHGIAIDPPAMRAAMQRAHAALPREHDGAFRYSDPWFRAFIAHVFVGELGLADERLAAVTEELFARFESARSFRVYPGAAETLATLRAHGLYLGVISNWSARLERLLEAVGLRAAFDAVHASALEGAEKPEAALFEHALARAGVAPASAVHAGDRPEIDVAGARAVGMQAVWVDHAADTPGECTARTPVGTPLATPRVASLPALAEWILEHAA